MTPSGLLLRRDGAPCPPVAYDSRILVEPDLDDITAIHRFVLANSRSDLFADEADGFFADHLARIGRILGVFIENKLIAYGVLGLPGPDDPNFGDLIDLPDEERPRVAHIDGAAVLPAWHGNGLHRVLIAWRLEQARKAGRSIALSTAAPENLPSVHNLLAEGMTIRALKQKFGGWRYVLRRDLDIPPPALTGVERWVEVTDIETQLNMLRHGLVGCRLESRRVSYAAP